jgi:uncharacterized membrane protein YozB (DUF420 family)
MQALRNADSGSRQVLTVSTPVVKARRLRHPAFFPGMSVLLITLVFVAFAPTYYLRPADAMPLPGYVHVHGAAMTAWFVLLLVQSLLIAKGRRSIHRRMGIAGVIVAIVMTVLNPFVAVRGVPRGLAAGLPIEFVAIVLIADFSAMAVFAVLAGLAIVWRRDPEAHSRMLLLASIAVMPAAMGRLSINTGIQLLGDTIQILLPLLVVAHDRIVAKRIHSASIWGSAAVIGMLPFNIAVANSQAGHWLVRLLDR